MVPCQLWVDASTFQLCHKAVDHPYWMGNRLPEANWARIGIWVRGYGDP